MSALTRDDLAMFAKIRVGKELLTQAGIVRVDDREGRKFLSMNGKPGRFEGVLIPNLCPATGNKRGYVIRRDHPDMENGKPKNKYMSSYGDRPHVYFAPGSKELIEDAGVPVVIVEAQKSVLAITESSRRTGKRILPVGINGCRGFRGRIGKVETPDGTRVDEKGLLPELEICKGRTVYLLFDSNAATKPDVRAARRVLAAELQKKGCTVKIIELPAFDGNGPDDYIGRFDDDAFEKLFGQAMAVQKDGTIRSNLAGAAHMLRTASEWSGVLAYNQFTLRTTTRKPAPWQSTVGVDWADDDDKRTAEWLQKQDVCVNTSVASEAVRIVAIESPFHPVHDYLKSLKWDGVPRLDAWLTTYLGVQDSTWSRAVGPRWTISACARIFEPGVQADYTLLLEGDQGTLKSSAVRALTGDAWFTDHLSDLGIKDSRMELRGKWIIELGEFENYARHPDLLARAKAFLTTRFDNFRPPYGRHTQDIPRSNVFCATYNFNEPFTDPSGNRRFWPVRCGEIDLAGLKASRDQLWAEAYVRYRNHEPWWLETKELDQLAAVEQDKRYQPGTWDDVIQKWLENPAPRREQVGASDRPIQPWDSDESRVTITDVLLHGVGIDIAKLKQADRNQVSRCLQHLGWRRGQEGKGEKRGIRFYYRPERSDHS
jgi:predicted P-loop ATPase